MKNIVYCAGDFISVEEARIPLTDRGFQFGDGAFATIQVQAGVPYFLDIHLARLEKQCRSFQLSMPLLSPDVVAELILRNGAYQGIWRLKIFVTGGDLLENRLPERRGRVLLLLLPFTPPPYKGLQMGIFPIPYSSCHASFKSLAHLNRLYVMQAAYERGEDDGITTTESGLLLEAAFGNLCFIEEGERLFYTPAPSLSLYFGVTISQVVQIAQAEGFAISYIQSPLSALPAACAAFRTNSMQGIRPIARIEHRHFTENTSLTALLQKRYEEILERERERWYQVYAHPALVD
jgi:branched-subunit amino acid aminotransferase/4-amino-4-deoxychorismate lyase